MLNPQASKQLTVNNYTKVYPNFERLFTYTNPKTIRLDKFDPITGQQSKTDTEQSDENHLRSLRRTKTAISDLVLCNSFELFVTFTFKNDRQNIDGCKKRMRDWLQSTRKTNKSFVYLIVPEFHKDGKSLHFHALVNGLNHKHLTKTKHKQKGRPVYNIKCYNNGFTTACFIDNQDKVSSYVKKYITKDMPKFENKQRFWSSKSLKKPEIVYNKTFDPMDYIQIYNNEIFTIYQTKRTLQPQTN